MFKRLLILTVFSAACVMIFAGVSHAAGTAAGVVITAEGYDNYVNYSGISGDPKATVYGPTLEATVLSIYGLDAGGPGTPDDQDTDPAVAVYYTYSITNSGNTGDTYALSKSIKYTGSYGSSWTTQFIRDDNQDGIHQGTETTVITSLTLAEDENRIFFLEVLPSSNAESGSRGTVTVTAETPSTPVGFYTGANGYPYGGPAFVNDSTDTDIMAPTIALTRVATIDAPTNYIQGSHVNPVPGSVVTITMTYSNEGTASSESNIIIDRVPPGHNMGHINVTGSILPDTTILAPAGTATGWTVSFTTEASLSSAQRLYGNTNGWVTLGTVSDNNYYAYHGYGYPDTLLSSETTYIKWEKATVEATEDGQTLTWGYIIR